MAPKSLYLRNIVDLQKRKMIASDVAEKLCILTNDRLQQTISTMFLDIVALQSEHVDILLAAESDKSFAHALREIKRQVAPRTLAYFSRNLLLSLMRFLSYLERLRPDADPEQIREACEFLVDKIVRMSSLTSTAHSKDDNALREKMNQMLYGLINRE